MQGDWHEQLNDLMLAWMLVLNLDKNLDSVY
jgi:hypothetical protein